jgi:hypothetical protein
MHQKTIAKTVSRDKYRALGFEAWRIFQSTVRCQEIIWILTHRMSYLDGKGRPYKHYRNAHDTMLRINQLDCTPALDYYIYQQAKDKKEQCQKALSCVACPYCCNDLQHIDDPQKLAGRFVDDGDFASQRPMLCDD